MLKNFKNSNFLYQFCIFIALNVDRQIKELETIEFCEKKNKTDKAFIDFLYRIKASISEERAKYI